MWRERRKDTPNPVAAPVAPVAPVLEPRRRTGTWLLKGIEVLELQPRIDEAVRTIEEHGGEDIQFHLAVAGDGQVVVLIRYRSPAPVRQ